MGRGWMGAGRGWAGRHSVLCNQYLRTRVVVRRYYDKAAVVAEQHRKDHPEWKFVRAPPRKGKSKVRSCATM